MARLELSEEQIETLELQANKAYEALEKAVSTREHEDADLAWRLYDGLYAPLSDVTEGIPFMQWQRGTLQADSVDRFALQYALGVRPAFRLREVTSSKHVGQEVPIKGNKITEMGVRNVIDRKGPPYFELRVLSNALAEKGNFDAVMGLLDYVREKYPLPKPGV